MEPIEPVKYKYKVGFHGNSENTLNVMTLVIKICVFISLYYV